MSMNRAFGRLNKIMAFFPYEPGGIDTVALLVTIISRNDIILPGGIYVRELTECSKVCSENWRDLRIRSSDIRNSRIRKAYLARQHRDKIRNADFCSFTAARLSDQRDQYWSIDRADSDKRDPLLSDVYTARNPLRIRVCPLLEQREITSNNIQFCCHFVSPGISIDLTQHLSECGQTNFFSWLSRFLRPGEIQTGLSVDETLARQV